MASKNGREISTTSKDFPENVGTLSRKTPTLQTNTYMLAPQLVYVAADNQQGKSNLGSSLVGVQSKINAI